MGSAAGDMEENEASAIMAMSREEGENPPISWMIREEDVGKVKVLACESSP